MPLVMKATIPEYDRTGEDGRIRSTSRPLGSCGSHLDRADDRNPEKKERCRDGLRRKQDEDRRNHRRHDNQRTPIEPKVSDRDLDPGSGEAANKQGDEVDRLPSALTNASENNKTHDDDRHDDSCQLSSAQAARQRAP